MLTKDTLRYKVRGSSITPSFLDTSSQQLTRIADDLIKVYKAGIGCTRIKIENQISGINSRYRDLKLLKGLNKILLDKCTFHSCKESSLIKKRSELFFQVNSTYSELSQDSSYTDFYNQVLSNNRFLSEIESIYEDLPEFDILEKINISSDPTSLLHRYNCTLAQSFLIYSEKMSVIVEEPDSTLLRGIVRFLKFFRLVASIQKIRGSASKYTLEIEGPATVLGSTTKYGIQIASFFPYILHFSSWKLSAWIHIKNKTYKLNLTDANNLISNYKTPASHTPEEITIFSRLFNEKNIEWKTKDTCSFLQDKDSDFIFPDFTFINTQGDEVHLELFHRWHASALEKRIDFCKSNSNFILGIDRSIYRKEEIMAMLNKELNENQDYFLFNDFPTIKKISDILSAIADSSI